MKALKRTGHYVNRKCPNDCGRAKPGVELLGTLMDTQGRQRKYCPDCGAAFIEEKVEYHFFICSECNRSINKDYSYCPYCGAKNTGRRAKNA